MKRVYYFGLSLIIAFGGCSSEGTIEVHNKTAEWMDVNVDEEYYNLDGYDYISKTYDLSNNIFSSEEKNVTVSGEGLVKWKFSENYTVKPDKTEKVNIYADAGAIKVWNNSYYTIVSVYLSPSSDYYWGSDELSGYIYSGHTHSWRVAPGYWDIKVVDNYGDSATSYDNYIGVGCVYWFTFYGYNSALSKSNSSNDLKNKNNFNFDFVTKDQVEKCNRLEHVDVYNLK